MMPLLVVCHANKWRSVLAEQLLRHFGVPAVSAGVNPATRGPAARPVRLWLQETHGLDVTAHRARPITQELLDAAPLVLYMDGGNLARLAQWRTRPGQLRCLAHWGGERRIPDPAFDRARLPQIAALLTRCCRGVADDLAAGTLRCE